MEELPYQPIIFIKTATIGSNNSQSQQASHSYDFSHHHIVIPRYINNHNIAFYILFHTASLYNWLRTVPCRESHLLASYLNQKNQNSNLFPKSPFNPENIISSLQQYVSKWQVAKLSFASSLYISKVKEGGPRACLHLPKTEQKSCLLSYHKINRQLFCESIFCKQCNRSVFVESQIRNQAPNFAIHKDKEGKIIPMEIKVDNDKYEIYIIYGKSDVKIKGANRIWYQIDQHRIRTIPQLQIDLKNATLAFYQREKYSSNQLTIPPPLTVQQQTPEISKDNIVDEKHEKSQEQQAQKQKQKMTLPKKNTQHQAQQKFGKIQKLRFEPNQVLLKENPNNQRYIEQVQKQFVAPKEKDEYQLDYDRGKLKKKKEKRTFIQPNYNQIEKQIKSRQAEMVGKQGKKIKKKEIRDKKKIKIKGLDSDSD